MNIPIHERYDEELKKREENLRRLKNEIEKKEDDDELNCTFKPKINKSKSKTKSF